MKRSGNIPHLIFEETFLRVCFPKSLYVNNFSYTVHSELTGIEVVNYDARAGVASVAARVMSKSTKQTSAASIAVGTVPISSCCGGLTAGCG